MNGIVFPSSAEPVHLSVYITSENLLLCCFFFLYHSIYLLPLLCPRFLLHRKTAEVPLALEQTSC